MRSIRETIGRVCRKAGSIVVPKSKEQSYLLDRKTKKRQDPRRQGPLFIQGIKMKHWNELEQSIFFNKVFSNLINIGTINLFSLQIENDRPRLGIGFDIPQFPYNLPEKWKNKDHSMCRTGLECSGISDLLIKNIPTSENLNVEIQEVDGFFWFSATSENSSIQFKARHINLSGSNVYSSEQNSTDVFTENRRH